jgi:PhnB protein
MSMAPNSGWDESPEHGNFSPESLGGGSVRMVLTVADPDAVFAQAVPAGASSRFEKNTVGDSAAWRIHSDIIGRLVDRSSHRRSEVFAICRFSVVVTQEEC